MIKSVRAILFCCAVIVATAPQIHAQGTAFTYQGRLNDGANPANGTYDLRFATYNANTNGSQTSISFTNPSVAVANGLFTVVVDLGNAPFSGTPQWLDIGVRTNGVATFTNVWPRPLLTATPYAVMAGSASNLVGSLPAAQLNGPISLGSLPAVVLTNGAQNIQLNGSFGGVFLNLTNQLPLTLQNLYLQIPTAVNLAGGTNFSAGQISSGTWTNASLNYTYKSFYTNYTVTPSDVVLNCSGTNQVITLLPAANFPPSTLLTIWSDNVNGSVIITNGTGYEAITVPGQGQGLSVLLGSANSPSNCVTLMVHGGHW